MEPKGFVPFNLVKVLVVERLELELLQLPHFFFLSLRLSEEMLFYADL